MRLFSQPQSTREHELVLRETTTVQNGGFASRLKFFALGFSLCTARVYVCEFAGLKVAAKLLSMDGESVSKKRKEEDRLVSCTHYKRSQVLWEAKENLNYSLSDTEKQVGAYCRDLNRKLDKLYLETNQYLTELLQMQKPRE